MTSIENKCINIIRVLSADAVQKANSGHPGMPMGAAPMAFALWAKQMKHNPKNPHWADRDRFVLSAGHGSMLLYSLLHLFKYGLSIEDLKQFRQWGSKTPGHPEYGHTVGVETTTGPLGQGFANAVGMAIAEAHLASKFNRPDFRIVDHYTYAISGDGCLMEGISSEAASLAGTLKLGKLIVLYDSNSITIEGSTDLAFTEDVSKRFEAYGWQVIEITDGNDADAINAALSEARSETEKPTLIKIKTIIGYGCNDKQGKASAHGEPLGEENLKLTKICLGFDPAKFFYVPDEVTQYMDKLVKDLVIKENDWNKLFKAYRKAFPELAKEWLRWHSSDLPIEFLDNKDFWTYDKKSNATRNISGEIINRLAGIMPNLIGGSADLAPSNKTYIKGAGDFSATDRSGRNFHFGVREHAMAAIGNGMSLHGGVRPFVSTFFIFSDYMKPAMRLSALMKQPLIYVLTHDSIGVGEDGPTHEPVEQLASLRSIPGFTIFRPADAKETAAGWYTAITRLKGPTALVLTRQNLPYYDESGVKALKGAYILLDSRKQDPDIILMASGSEVSLIYNAKKVLDQMGIDARVVSMPSWEIFEEQSDEYKSSVLPNKTRARLAVEAASSFGWHKYTGIDGAVISIDTFGASAPQEILFREFGLTVEKVVEKAAEIVRKKGVRK